MPKVLVVEDSQSFGKYLCECIKEKSHFDVVWTKSFAETKRILQESGEGLFIAILDLHLPDAGGVEIVDLVTSAGVPSVVFTGDFSDDIRDQVLQKGVLDYFIKEHLSVVESVVTFVIRLHANAHNKVLIVDDSRSARMQVITLLRKHRYQVLGASGGKEALKLIREHKDIKLAIVDFNMAEMDGFQLTKKIRMQYQKEKLAIIGLSSYGNNILSAKFIKYGANDFISKPFLAEEFYCRVAQNIDFLDHISSLSVSQNKMIELNNSLLETAQLRDNVDGIMQHDIKSPLGIIISGPEMIREFGEVNEAQNDLLRRIETSGYHILDMVNRSLDLQKMESGKYELKRGEVDLGIIIKNAISELSVFCQSKEISIIKSGVEWDSVIVLGEDMLCYSIFSNLIKNAIEASPDKGNVEVKMDLEGEWVEISIYNKGRIPEQIRDRFFEKYVSCKKISGTGIGTYSSQLFTKIQGGEIRLDTQTDPDGTVIVVSFPRLRKSLTMGH